MDPKEIQFETEFIFKTSRSGGAGGQNVNKVATKVQLDFDVPNSTLLTDEQKELISQKLSSRISKEGILQIVSQAERTQLGNKDVAIALFYELITKALTVQKKRKATRPSKSAVQKRLTTKKRDSEIKELRRKVGE